MFRHRQSGSAASARQEVVEFKTIIAPILLAALLLDAYAALQLCSLYGDSPSLLVKLIVREGIRWEEPSRRSVQLLQALPTVLALKLGVRDLYTLAVLYGFTMQVLPLLLLVACYPVLPKEQKQLFALPLFCYLAGIEASAYEPLAEGAPATAYFWLLLFAVVFRGQRKSGQLAILVGSLPCIFSYEAMAFLAPILALAAIWRARNQDLFRGGAVFFGLAAWFLIVSAMQMGFTLHPAHSDNRDEFFRSLFRLQFLGDHRGINTTAFLGLIAGAALVTISWLEAHGHERRGHRAAWIIAAVFGAICAAAIVATGLTDILFQPNLDSAARAYGAFLSLPLVVVFFAAIFRWKGFEFRVNAPAATVIILLATGAFGWRAIGVHYWSEFIANFRAALATHEGLVTWRESDASAARALSWGWTYPSLSILLAPGGRVVSIIQMQYDGLYRPFDPADPAALPDSPLFDMRPYRDALAAKGRSG